MKSITELAHSLVARRAEARELREQRWRLLHRCTNRQRSSSRDYGWEDYMAGTIPCGRVRGILHCETCCAAVRMRRMIVAANRRAGAAMGALTKAVNREVTP